MARRKHYFKLADYLGTFKFHLEQFGKATINQIDYDTKQDLVNEFINMKDNITTMLKKDNKLFCFDKFNNEIDRIYREGFSQIDTQSLGDVSSEGLGANQ